MLYLRSQVTPFVIMFVERSGITYLATLLGSHPDVLGKREEFAHIRQRGRSGKDQLHWAERFWNPPWIGRHKAIGFKSKLADILDPAGFRHLLFERKVHVIQLQRENLVKAVVSTINARRLHKASGNWNLLKESDRLPAFRIDVNLFDRMLQERIRWDKELEGYVSSLMLPKVKLNYEELLRDEDTFTQKVFEFIGVETQSSLKGKTLKNTNDDLRNVILNFDELCATYAGTRYQEMFTEVVA